MIILIFQNKRVKKIVNHFLRITNGSDSIELKRAYNDYQSLYVDIKKNRRLAIKTLEAILDSVRSLAVFIKSDLGKLF